MDNTDNNKDYTSEKKENNSRLEKMKKKNEFIKRKVEEWQNFPYVKPLVCDNPDCNETKLKPKETKYRVILQCPKCRRVQTYVPAKVTQIELRQPKVLLDNQKKRSRS